MPVLSECKPLHKIRIAMERLKQTAHKSQKRYQKITETNNRITPMHKLKYTSEVDTLTNSICGTWTNSTCKTLQDILVQLEECLPQNAKNHK